MDSTGSKLFEIISEETAIDLFARALDVIHGMLYYAYQEGEFKIGRDEDLDDAATSITIAIDSLLEELDNG